MMTLLVAMAEKIRTFFVVSLSYLKVKSLIVGLCPKIHCGCICGDNEIFGKASNVIETSFHMEVVSS